MTTQATQSNNATGRRSLPSTFFAPLQSARRYMERQRAESGEDAGRSGERLHGGDRSLEKFFEDSQPVDRQAPAAGDASVPDPATAGLIGGTAAEAVLAAILRLKIGEQTEGEQDAAQERTPLAFAEVARQVWCEELEGERDSPVVATAQAVSTRSSISLTTVAQDRAQPSLQASEAQGLAHDANNLLSALRLYSELLCFSGVLHERHRHYAEDLKLLSMRSQGLIERLLRLADAVSTAEDMAEPYAYSVASGGESAVASKPPVEEAELGLREPVSLAETVLRLRGVLATIAHGALECSVAEHELPVGIDEEALERILVNLVSNAAAAVRGGGAIRVRASVLDGASTAQAVLTVDDSGCGMSDAQLAAARGEDLARLERTDGGRHGVGLSIVRQLVAASGGEFFVYSRIGTGTRIEIRWQMPSATLHDSDADPGLLLVPDRRSAVALKGFTRACFDSCDGHVAVSTGAAGAIAC